MKNGSVIVDLAAENGGNCALTEPGEVVERYGVHILGYTDLPSRLAPTASLLFGNNLTHLLADLGGASHFHLDLADEVVRGALVLRERRAAVAAAGEAADRAAAGPEGGCGQDTVPRIRPPEKKPSVAGPIFAIVGGRRVRRASGWWRRPRSCRTSRCSRSRASSGGRWCGTSRRRCTRR